MSLVFLLDGNEIYSIPLSKATTENKLWWIDTLAEAYDVYPCKIETKVVTR